MLTWFDIYKVIEAMVPLYVALGLGYGSVRWWKIFKEEQCEAINRLVAYFCFPLFVFDFTLHIDPFTMNYHIIGADAVSKLLIIAIVFAWAKCNGKANSCCWSITTYSLSTLTNALVVGVPMARAMYGQWAVDLVVQLSVVQAIVWLSVLLFVLEVRKAGDGGGEQGKDVENIEATGDVEMAGPRSFWVLMKVVWLKLALNPNSYASICGIIWAFISKRWHFEMPGIIEGSVSIMAKAGTGMAMFSMGLFMALQEKIIACGPSLAAFGIVLKFIAGPAAAAIGAIAVGLRGQILQLVIIQAALPQSITSFIYAREYGLHADVLSTAVIFGMLISLPVLVGYYALLRLFI